MDSAQKFLTQEYARRRQINSRYSQRAFARQVGLSPGELSEVLSGKRRLSLKSALRIAKSMGLTATETKHLVHLAQVEKSRTFGSSELLEPTLPTLESQALTEDVFFLISAWYCFAILNLADCEGFRWDPSWIARRLGITKLEVLAAFDKLERVGIVKTIDGKKQIAKDYISNLGGIPSESVRNYHKDILQKAAQALDFQSLEERELSGVGLAVDPKHIPSIKKDIIDFQEQVLAKYSKGKKKHVYQLEIAFFRLSQGDTND